MRIGIFDSGIGGLTVLKNIYKHFPNNEYIYLGDTKNLPYGNKKVSQLYKLASSDIEFLISNNVDMIVIACGTVSSNCSDYLREKYDVPIIDIVGPTVKYLNESNYNNIGVIATNATIDSGVFDKNINKKIYGIKTPLFVTMIENNDYIDIDSVISNYLDRYKNKIDVLVLGCTHYPLIKDYISKYFDNRIYLIDMSDLLLDRFDDGLSGSISIYYSKLDDIVIKNTKMILGIDSLDIMLKK